jgi:hypothetical protein
VILIVLLLATIVVPFVAFFGLHWLLGRLADWSDRRKVARDWARRRDETAAATPRSLARRGRR